MRKLIAFCSLVFIPSFYASSLLAQATPPLKTWEYKEAAFKEDTFAVLKQEHKEFNPTGSVTKYILFVANPIMDLVKSLEVESGYDTHGNYEQITKYDEGGEPILVEKTYFAKDKKNKLRTENIDYIKKPDDILIRVWKYNDDMQPLSVSHTNKNGKIVGEEHWKYNSTGEEIKYTKWEFNEQSKKNTEEKSTAYDKAGNLQKSVHIQKINGEELREEIIFENNRVKEKIRLKNGQVVSSFGGANNKSGGFDPSKAKTLVDFGGDDEMFYDSEDIYDDNGVKIKTIKSEGIEIAMEILYSYDAKGNLINSKTVYFTDGEANGEEEEIVYEYDEYNNKTREAKIERGILMQEKTYVFQYFK